MSEIKIFNSNIDMIGVIDNFNSIKWVQKFYEHGTFSIKLPLTPEYISVLKKDNIIYFDGNAGFIESVEFDMGDEGETITITGKELLAWLARRINWNITNYNGTVEGFARQIVNDSCIAALNAERNIPYLELGALHNFTEAISKQDSYGNILEILNAISKTSDIGFRILFVPKEKKFIFDSYKGASRTVHQSELAPLVFCREFENILQQTYIESQNSYANTALIAGVGEDINRKVTSIETGTGLSRYEIFIDARDIENTIDGTTLSDAKYSALLQQRGIEKLADYYSVTTFDSTVNTVVTSDFNVGDLVTVNDKQWNISLDTRITEIEKIYENTGKTINVTFGNDVPTIYDKLKKGMI